MNRVCGRDLARIEFMSGVLRELSLWAGFSVNRVYERGFAGIEFMSGV